MEIKHRFAVLDVFRGIFASVVFLFHLDAYSDTPILNNRFITNSDLFVDFFFVLSGFVVSYSYQSIGTGKELLRFYKKRFLRLYPLHLLLLLIYVVAELLRSNHNPNNNVTTFFSNLFLLNSVKLPHVNDVSWNHPSWSISAEMIAYLVFGGVALYINRAKLSKYRNVFYLSVGILALAGLFVVTGSFGLMYTFNYGFLRGIAGFFLGAFCFTVFNRFRPYFSEVRPLLYSFAEVGLLLAIIVMVSLGRVLKPYGLVYEALFLLCIFTFSFEKGALSRLLKKSPILRRIGLYSYSIYMTHAFLIGVFDILFFKLLKVPAFSYNFLPILEYYIVYQVSAFTYKQVEMRFNYKTVATPR